MDQHSGVCFQPPSSPINLGPGTNPGITPPPTPPVPPSSPGNQDLSAQGGGGKLSCGDGDSANRSGTQPIAVSGADPINFAVGNLYETEVDFVGVVSSMPLRIERTYNSLGAIPGLFGTHWSSNLDTQASLNIAGTQLSVRSAAGQVIVFNQSGSTWITATTLPITLIANSSGYLLTTYDKHQYQFNAAGQLLTLTNARGESNSYQYANGKLNTVADSYGNQLTLTYDSTSNLVSTISVAGQTIQYMYQDDGTGDFRLYSVTYPAMNVTPARYYGYNNTQFPWALTYIVNETGLITSTWGYDAKGRANENDRAGLEKYTVDYTHISDSSDPYSLVTSVNPNASNGSGYQWKYHLQTGGDGLVRVVHIEGLGSPNCSAASNYTSYDSNNHPITVTDGNGNVTLRHYASNGQVDQEINGYRWGSNGNTGSIADLIETAAMHKRVIPTGQWDVTNTWPLVQIESGKNEQGQWVDYRETDRSYANGRVFTLTIKDLKNGPVYPTRSWFHVYTYYDAPTNTKLASDQVTGPLGSNDLTTYYYDLQGHLQQVKNGLLQITTYSGFNVVGLPTLMTAANNVISQLGYDGRNRLNKVVRNYNSNNPAQGQLTQIDHYDNGLLKQITLPDSSWIKYTYSDGVHLSRIDDNAGNYILLTPSVLNGEWTAREVHDATSVLRITHQRVFDDIGRLLYDLDIDGQGHQYVYDLANNLQSFTDALGNGVVQNFDALNRLIAQTDSLNHTANFKYDGLDHIASVQDVNGNTTTYLYDGLGNLRTIISPDSGTTTLWPDAAGNVLKKIDGRGVESDFVYDVLSRLKTITYPSNSSENVTNTYDDVSNGNFGIGHLTGYSNDGDSTALTYDAYGNIIKRIETIVGQSYTTQFQYDTANRLKQTTFPDGHIETLTRNIVGQINQVQTQTNASASAQTVASNITYLPFGAATGQVLGNGLNDTRSFTLDGRAQSSSGNLGPSSGDINGDAQLTLGDLLLVQKYLLGQITLTADQQKMADVNGDGFVTFSDWLTLQQKVLHLATH